MTCGNWIAGVSYLLAYFSPVGGWQLNFDFVRRFGAFRIRFFPAATLAEVGYFLRRLRVFSYLMKPFQNDSTYCLFTPALRPVTP